MFAITDIFDIFSNKKNFSCRTTSGSKTVVGNWRFTTVSLFDLSTAFMFLFIIEISSLDFQIIRPHGLQTRLDSSVDEITSISKWSERNSATVSPLMYSLFLDDLKQFSVDIWNIFSVAPYFIFPIFSALAFLPLVPVEAFWHLYTYILQLHRGTSFAAIHDDCFEEPDMDSLVNKLSTGKSSHLLNNAIWLLIYLLFVDWLIFSGVKSGWFQIT